jgi:hypothetical protein
MSTEGHVIHLENGELAADTPLAKVQAIAQAATRHTGPGGIVLHFHGGLVSYNAGLEIADFLTPHYEGAQAYPVFFVWESGLLETLGNNLGEIAREAFFLKLWKKIAEIALRRFRQSPGERAATALPTLDAASLDAAIDEAVARGDVAGLVASEPSIPVGLEELTDTERAMVENELMLDTELMREVQQISRELRDPAAVQDEIRRGMQRVQGSTRTLMDWQALDRLVERSTPQQRGLISAAKLIKAVVMVVVKVIARFARGRDHGFHATVVEEILRELYLANAGGVVWNLMKKDTADAFQSDGQVYGGTAFLEALRDAIDADRPPRITLIGHSTGAVFISEFLDKSAATLPLRVRFDVVLLAPASRFEKTAATLDKHAARIAGFRMFAMQDAVERDDCLVPVLYPSSLLYFISGVLEGGDDVPLVGMQRFFDRAHFPDAAFPAVRTVRDYVTALPSRAVWSVTGDAAPAGQRSASRHHTDFDNDDLTLASVEHILEAGS